MVSKFIPLMVDTAQEEMRPGGDWNTLLTPYALITPASVCITRKQTDISLLCRLIQHFVYNSITYNLQNLNIIDVSTPSLWSW